VKSCNYCQEEVQENAVRCPHCSSWLESHPDSSAPQNSIVYVLDRGIVRFAKFAMAILAMFLIVGAFFYGFDLKQASKEIADVKERTLALEKDLVKERDKVIELKEDAERLTEDLVAEREVVANLKDEMAEQAEASKKHLEEVVGYRTRAREIVASISTTGIDETHIATVVKRVLVRDLGEAIPEDLRRELEKVVAPRSGSVAEIIEQRALEMIGLGAAVGDSGRLASVKVAILSERTSSDLQALQPNLLEGKDFLTFKTPAEYSRYPVTDHFNGIASLIVAISPKTKILPIRVLSPNGGMATMDDIERGLDFAVSERVRVIVLPFGASSAGDRLYQEFMKQARRRNVVVVAPAGNAASTDKVYPAALPEVLSVAATDSQDRLTRWSNYGDWVSLAAPGEEVTIMGDDGKLKATNGGSFSAAIAAGAAALLISMNPDVSADRVRDVLIQTAKPLSGSPEAPQKSIGGGRIDLAAAINELDTISIPGGRDSPDSSTDRDSPPDGKVVRKEMSQREMIPDSDPSGLKSSLSIDSPGTIKDIQLDVNVAHTYVGDVRIVLRSPNGQELTLRDRVGGPGDGIRDSYTPERVAGLKALIGTPARGEWTLIISDHSRLDVGALEQWGIRFTLGAQRS